MNRKQRRELRKDKNLINELYSIIKKYLPKLLDKFNNLTDFRNQNYIKYSMKTICVTRLFPLLCGITTMTDISSDYFNTDNCINNLANICNENFNICDIRLYNKLSKTDQTDYYLLLSDLNYLKERYLLNMNLQEFYPVMILDNGKCLYKRK